jgi:hypothetical protein
MRMRWVKARQAQDKSEWDVAPLYSTQQSKTTRLGRSPHGLGGTNKQPRLIPAMVTVTHNSGLPILLPPPHSARARHSSCGVLILYRAARCALIVLMVVRDPCDPNAPRIQPYSPAPDVLSADPASSPSSIAPPSGATDAAYTLNDCALVPGVLPVLSQCHSAGERAGTRPWARRVRLPPRLLLMSSWQKSW